MTEVIARYPYPASNSFIVTIPQEVAQALQVSQGELMKWTVISRNGTPIAQVIKAENSPEKVLENIGLIKADRDQTLKMNIKIMVELHNLLFLYILSDDEDTKQAHFDEYMERREKYQKTIQDAKKRDGHPC